MKLYEKEIDIVENENSFEKLIDMCKDGGTCFGDILLNYESIDLGVMVCYLNLAMTSYAILKFKDIMIYTKLSGVVTMFEEAFAILVIESNLIQWIYCAKKRLLWTKH